MWLGGQPYAPRHPADARRAGVSMIYQELSLAPHLSVMENIALGMEPRRGPLVRREAMRRQAIAAMSELGRPDVGPETPVRQLAPAEQQLVEIGRALSVGCRVLVLDEPTSSLSVDDAQRLFALVRQLRQRGLAIIYISHFLEEMRTICNRFAVLRNGRSVGGGAVACTANEDVIRLMVGRSVDDLYPRSPRTAGEALLELDSLAGEKKPAGASLVLHRGEVLGIAGLIGSGRTEMLRAVFGLDAVRSGRVTLKGFSGWAEPARQWSRGMGMLSEDRKSEGLALRLSLAENITLSSMPRWIRPGHLAERSGRWINRLGIRCRGAAQVAGDLSGGNQQKVAIARLLEHGVDVLLLDEPTRGIDVAAKAEVYRVIDELACAGKGILLVSSYLPELMGVCDRIAVMCKGRLGPARPVAAWDEHQIMVAATQVATSAG